MGATITCGKKAAAFEKNGIIYYILWERTYESNVHPHNPHWECTYIGPLDGTLRRIFIYASSCEGGMLAGPGKRHILPENYISAWLRKLAAPVAMPNAKVRL